MFKDDSSNFLNMCLTRLLRWGDDSIKTQYITVRVFTTSVFSGGVLLYVMTEKVKASITILT